MLGTAVKTALILRAGNNPIFGPPWNPEECVLNVPLDEQSIVIVRVLDYKDHILGELELDIRSISEDEVIAMQLYQSGKVTSSVVSFTMQKLTTESTIAGIRLQVLSLSDLHYGFLNFHHLSVQAYGLPADTPLASGAALPDPISALVLPPDQISLPFEFQLPPDLPSSYANESHRHYIVYSIFANIEANWKYEVTHRVFFTIQQPTAAATMLTPIYKTVSHDVYPQGCLPPCCCLNIPLVCLNSYGTMKVDAYLERSAYAPGETMKLICKVTSDWNEVMSHLKMTAQLVQRLTLSAEFAKDDRIKHRVTDKIDIVQWNEPTYIRVPSVPPSYLGTVTQDSVWHQKWAERGKWGTRDAEPVVWRYVLKVTVLLSVPGVALYPMKKKIYLPVIICGVGLSLLPSISASASLSESPQLSPLGVNSSHAEEKDGESDAGNQEEPPVTQSDQVRAAVSTQSDSSPNAVVSQSMDRRDYEYVQSSDSMRVVFPDFPTFDIQEIPDWKRYPMVAQSLSRLAQCPTVPQASRPTVIREYPG